MFDFFKNLMNLRRPKVDDRGASAVEYGLLIAGIAALIIVAVFALGPIIAEQFDNTRGCIEAQACPAP